MLNPLKGLIQVKISLFRKIFVSFLALIVFFIASSYTTYRFFFEVHESEIKMSYGNSLSTLRNSTDTIIREIYQNVYLLSTDQDLIEILYTNRRLPVEQYNRLIHVRELMLRFIAAKEMVANMSILLKESGLVVSTDSTTGIGNYFDTLHQYEAYDQAFWMNYESKGTKFRVLKPSRVRNRHAGQVSTVIPVVIQEVGRYSTSNLLIIDLKADYFAGALNEHKLTANSQVFILDADGRVFSRTPSGAPLADMTDRAFLERLQANGSQPFTFTWNGRRMLVISRPSGNPYLNGYTYVACVPYSDLEQRLSFIKSFTFTASLASLLLAVGLSFAMSRRLYRPIRSLAYLLSMNRPDDTDTGPSRDELDYINNRVNLLMNSNESLTRDLSAVVPLLQEKYLLKLLNSDHYLLDAEFQSYWEHNDIVFHYQEFVVAAAELSFTGRFFAHFGTEERASIVQGLKKILLNVFPKEWKIYMLAEKNKLILILNLPPDTEEAELMECTRRFAALFQTDQEYLNLSIGLGRKYPDNAGILKSYKEALGALSAIAPYAKERVRAYREESPQLTYSLRIDEENRFFNYLMGGYHAEAAALLQEVVERNLSQSLPENLLKELYLRLYRIALKAAEVKSIPVPEPVDETSRSVTSLDISAMAPQELGEHLTRYIEALCESLGANSKLDIQQIVRYIDEHYAEDIYLDQMADLFGTSGKYLSRFIRNALGIPFQQYLSNLRIGKAKELMRNTSRPIHDIAGMVGFNNRNTFIRMFKKLEGVTPSEYRNYHRGEQAE